MTKTKQHKCRAHGLCVLAVAIFLGATAVPLHAQEKQEPDKAPDKVINKAKAKVKAKTKAPTKASTKARTEAPSQQVTLQQEKQANKDAANRQAPNPKQRNLRKLRATPQRAKRGQPPTKAQPAKRSIPKPTVVLKPGEVPAIKFDTPTYEFGRIRSGTDVLHDFWFTNTGTGPLEILRVKPS